MADQVKNLIVNTGGASYSINTSDIYTDMGISEERFAELLARDFFCPLMPSAPTAGTLTYTDTDGSVNHFSVGQECRVPDVDSAEYAVYKFMGTYQGNAVWQKMPSKVSDLPNDAGYVQTADYEDELPDPDITYATKDLSMYDIHGESIRQTTANCYVVSRKGKYMFPIAYGAAIKNGAVNAAAYTKVAGDYSMDFVNYKDEAISSPYIETDTNTMAVSVELSMADTDGVFETVGIAHGDECRYAVFKVKDVPSTGANAVISVLDGDGVVMWSWHIWVWPDDLTPVTITGATGVDYNILPVNLATKKSTTEGKVYNWFYQWGRPTPMLPPNEYNSDQDADNYGVRTFSISTDNADTYGTGIRNPQMFYANSSTPYNWFGTLSYYNLWDANCIATGSSDNVVVKTVYDPCPAGYMMPNGRTFSYFYSRNVIGNFNNGRYFKRNSSDTTGVFIPASGSRNSGRGALNGVGGHGYLWYSSVKNSEALSSLYFYSGDVYTNWGSYRSEGISVRPVQE